MSTDGQLSHPQIRLWLVDKSCSRASLLKRTLMEFDFEVSAHLSDVSELLAQATQTKPDCLIISVDKLHSATLRDLAQFNLMAPCPVVIFAQENAPQAIQGVIQAGVSAYVVDEIQPMRIGTIIDVALARFVEQQKLLTELNKTKAKLAERKLLDKAKGLLMQHKSITENEAYQCLRKLSMDKGQTLAQVAQNTIEVLSMLSDELH